MNILTNFAKYQTDNEIDLYLCRNPKFKTNSINFYIIRPLTANSASRTALIPRILYRGSRKYRTTRHFKIKLNELYGADLTVSIIKKGELQILEFSLEIVNEKYLPQQESLLAEGITLLQELIKEPVFSRTYFEQERNFIIKKIKSLINDKYNYSLYRCYQNMCKNEPYSVHKLGTIEGHSNLSFDNVYTEYRKVLRDGYMLCFVIGDIDPDSTYSSINKCFTFKHKQPDNFNKTVIKKKVKDIKEIQERKDINQGKLIMGYRTGITRKDKLYYALLVYNGILGAFPHSKLFKNVREKTGLAYYANSTVETTKGLLMVTSGIDFNKYNQARKIIMKQVDDIKIGKITEQEFKWTKKSLISSFKSSADSSKGLSGHYLLGLINDREETIDISMKQLSGVTREDVIKAGTEIELDTIYFLNRKEKS